MKFTDVVTLTQKAVAQTLGAEYMEQTGDLASLDSYKLVDVGKDVLDSGSVDVYVKALLTQLGKLVVDSKKYASEIPSIFIDSFDWGGYVERVYFSPQDLIKDEMYDLVDGNTYEDHKFYKPNASAKIFEEAKTIMCPISITTEQLTEAFSSWEQMNKFLSGIRTNVENTITIGLEAYAHMLVSCGIAVSSEATKTMVHLVTEYNALHPSATVSTGEKALEDENFVIFAMQRISKIKKFMQRYTTAFNNGSIPTFTNPEDCKTVLLTDFASATKFIGKRNTYNPSEIGFGDYDEVSCWQAFANTETIEGEGDDDDTEVHTNFKFDTNASISIGADSHNKLGIGTSAVELDNVIGVVYDSRAMGICPFKSKVTSNYTAIADFWNEYHHQLVNYILDANYNIVAFDLN